jgi:hypothetical protein
VTLPRLLRNLRLRTREDAELECALQQLHRTPAQPATAAPAATTGSEQAQQPDVPEAQEQPASVPPEIADGASSCPAAIRILACSCMHQAPCCSPQHVCKVSGTWQAISLDPTRCVSCFSSVRMLSDGTDQVYVH